MKSKCGKNKKVAHEAIAECVIDDGLRFTDDDGLRFSLKVLLYSSDNYFHL